MKGFTSILIIALWLSPSEGLPDLLAPFRNMFGMKPSNSPSHVKQLSSGKDPSASHVHKHFGGHGGHGGPPSGPGGPGGPEDDDPFPSNFGFGRPPPDSGPQSDGPPFGGGSFPPRGSPYSRPSPSSNPSSGRPSRPVRQQPGSPFGGGGGGGHRHQPSYRPSYHSQGPSSHGGGPESQDESSGPGSYHQSGPPSYNQGGPPPHHQRSPPPSYHQQSESPSYQGGGAPSFHSSTPSYQSGPPSYQGGSYQGGSPRPYQGGSPGSQYSPEGPQSEGSGFNGYGAYPPNNQEDDSPPPRSVRPTGGPSYRPQSRPFRASRPASSPGGSGFDGSSSPPTRYPGGPGSSTPSQFFGGPSDYPEQFDGGNRGTREPQIITADDVNKYPAQINDDDQGQGGPGGFGPPSGGGGGFGFDGPPQGSSSFPPSPFGGGGEGEDGPDFHGSRPSYPSGSGKSFAYSRPVSAGYQASSESVHYGKPMMMSASGNPVSKIKAPRGPLKNRRRSAKKPKIVRLASPRDPNYRSMSSSSVDPVTAPFDSDPAATGHGHGGHGGDEMSSNGDRILYHVSGHQGPYSYRFGYDTGKGSYNRLFRFEEKDGKGYVKGKYGFYDKHGKLNLVNYEAHPKHGFHAERGHSHGLY